MSRVNSSKPNHSDNNYSYGNGSSNSTPTHPGPRYVPPHKRNNYCKNRLPAGVGGLGYNSTGLGAIDKNKEIASSAEKSGRDDKSRFKTGGGNGLNEKGNSADSSTSARNIVLVGKTGNGESATGKTILGRNAFESTASPCGVTRTCQIQQTVLRDGQILNVIDTPGKHWCSCQNRFVLFNNKTNKGSTKEHQVWKPVALVNKVTAENGGKPYSPEFIEAVKEGSLNLNDQDQLKQITEQVEQRLGNTVKLLEQQLAEEHAARVQAQQIAEMKSAEQKSARLLAEQLAQNILADAKAARLKVEQLAQQELALEQVAQLRSGLQFSRKQLEEERAARLRAEKLAEKQFEGEKDARCTTSTTNPRRLARAQAATEHIERATEEE